MFRTARSVLRSAWKGIREDPELRRWRERHPRFLAYVRRRLSPDEKFGLNLTVGLAIVVFFAYLFLGVAQDLIAQEAVYLADYRILNLLQIFRSPRFSQTMLFITYLGGWPAILAGSIAAGLFLAVLRRWRYLVGFIAAVLGGELFVYGMKMLFRRPRPPLINALTPETGYSFPSGHVFVAIVFYGLLAYFVWRGTRRRAVRALAIAAGLFAVVLIGFSRLYLGVHWPSDVLASLAAGAAWLTAVITALEIRRKFGRIGVYGYHFRRRSIALLGAGLSAAWLAFVIAYFAVHPLKPQPSFEQPDVAIGLSQVPAGLFGSLPRTSETLTGEPMEPINVIAVGTRAELDRAFRDAGWLPCDPVTLRSTWRLMTAGLFDRPYPQAPGVPSFWDSLPNDFAYERSTAADTVRERYHIHFWYTPFLLPDGRRIWFATAHFDTGVKVGSSAILPIHTIDPAIDRTRDKVAAELSRSGDVEIIRSFQLVDPELGRNQAGDVFFTDGKADVVYLKPRPANPL